MVFMPTLGPHPHKVVLLLIHTTKPIAHSLCGEAGVSQVEEVVSVSPLISHDLSAHVRR